MPTSLRVEGMPRFGISQHMTDIRLIIDPPAPGPWNMAVDEALLRDAIENGHATLRFYEWSEPTLSLGYFQCYEDRHQHPASQASAVVRRQSGGGAILHDRELTYSLILPPGHPLTSRTAELYESVHQAFIAAVSKNQTLNSTLNLRIRGQAAQTPAGEPFLCFQRQSPGDVVVDLASETKTSPAPLPVKVLGSAQRRHRGAILQHGSLLIEMSTAAPELPGLRDLEAGEISAESLISAVCGELATRLGLRFSLYRLSTELQSNAEELANTKYGTESWTKRR
jgi:lipoate-protein ligase A